MAANRDDSVPRETMGCAAYGRALPLAGLVILVDQLTKWWILDLMDPPRQIEVTPFFNLVLAWNRGVSFSLFHSGAAYAPYILSAVALAVVAGLLWWVARQERLLPVLAIGLVVGGAIGNVIDRLNHGAVVDFLDVHAAGWHWPAFNVADSAITIGVVGLVADGLFGDRYRSKT